MFRVGAGNKIEYRAIEPGRLFNGLRIVCRALKAGDLIVVEGAEPFIPVSCETAECADDSQREQASSRSRRAYSRRRMNSSPRPFIERPTMPPCSRSLTLAGGSAGDTTAFPRANTPESGPPT